VGGWDLLGEVPLRLWIESAHQSLTQAGAKVCGDVVRTLQTEEQFFAVLVSSPQGDEEGRAKTMPIADRAASLLEQGTPLERVVETLLATLPDGEHMPFAILQAKTLEVSEDLPSLRAHLVECDAPPLFLTRGGQLVLPPVLEDISHGRLVRECRFLLQNGDRMAMVSEGFIHARGWDRRWVWRDIAIATRRWTDTGCDAEQLLGALIRSYHRVAGRELEQDVTVIAMNVRPMRSATVWSGPPADPALDQVALKKLMAEPGTRVICGDTTAAIATRLLGAELELEPRPEDSWTEVPPTSRLEGVNLVTEGLVTLGKARERVAGAKRVRDRSAVPFGCALRPCSGQAQDRRSRRSLPRKTDGATRLAQMLLSADGIHFIVGLAVNPEQAADAAGTIPMRRIVIDDLVRDLEAHGKVVSVESF
jgi:hypothetical protein